MKNYWKNILLTLCAAMIVLLISCSYLAGRQLRGNCICKGLKVIVTDSLENNFVSAADIRKILDKSRMEYIGMAIDSIDLVRVEEIVESRSAVHGSDAYVTKDGTLHIEVTQRKPVVRFQKKDGGFYADDSGYIFPLQSSFSSHVQIIDGNIPLAANSGYKGAINDPKEREWFESIMNLVNFMERNNEWKDKIVQVHVQQDGNIVLIPREGNERFILGQPKGLEDKFFRMKKYYTAVLPEKGSKAYRTVDLRFKGQIVCR